MSVLIIGRLSIKYTFVHTIGRTRKWGHVLLGEYNLGGGLSFRVKTCVARSSKMIVIYYIVFILIRLIVILYLLRGGLVDLHKL